MIRDQSTPARKPSSDGLRASLRYIAIFKHIAFLEAESSSLRTSCQASLGPRFAKVNTAINEFAETLATFTLSEKFGFFSVSVRGVFRSWRASSKRPAAAHALIVFNKGSFSSELRTDCGDSSFP